jgi:hypothetical protein
MLHCSSYYYVWMKKTSGQMKTVIIMLRSQEEQMTNLDLFTYLVGGMIVIFLYSVMKNGD